MKVYLLMREGLWWPHKIEWIDIYIDRDEAKRVAKAKNAKARGYEYKVVTKTVKGGEA